jgi:hypothetical protein
MTQNFVRIIGLLTSLAFLGPLGCDKEAGPPPPLAVEAIPVEMQKAFHDAQPEAKENVGRLNSALQSKDFPTAYQEVQNLCNLPGETREQRALAARALLTLTGLLQTAQAQGDENAAAALKLRQTTR